MRILWVIIIASLPALAHAEMYSFVDEDGVIHFTNIPNDPRYQLLNEGENTFRWTDGMGVLRKVHRIDVTSFDPLIIEAARYYGLPPALVKAVVAVESSFEAGAVSHAGAQGSMQLIPQTAGEMFVQNPFDARDNIYGGVRYLRVLANQFGGDLRLTIAAYNAGPKAVAKARDIPPFAETRRYVQRVLAVYRHYLETWKTTP